MCSCGELLKVLKTGKRTVFTLAIGKFHAHKKTFKCDFCNKVYVSDELKRLVPDGSNYGFDVLEYVGRSLFLKGRNVMDIQTDLRPKQLQISPRQIGCLGSKFVIYLALCHENICPEIKKLFQKNGGYILHIDGTCEGDSPILVNVIDGITGIVLSSIKLTSEKKILIVSILKKIKKDFGIPLAMMHDMGKGIVLACEEVFENVLDFICHLHFLRDIGKDFFGQEYNLLFKNLLKQHKTRILLRAELKRLKNIIENDSSLNNNLLFFEQSNSYEKKFHQLQPTNMAYVLTAWILDYENELNGYGFPFDRRYIIWSRLGSGQDKLRLHKEITFKKGVFLSLNTTF